ncbi:MAG: NhaP-type Na+/H+ or K+/H+ antiporter [Paraglaciecola sp.]
MVLTHNPKAGSNIMISNAQWFLLIGGLLIFMGLTASRLRALPVTTAIIYLAAGLLLGPSVLNMFHFNPLKQSALLEVLTEIAVLISLYSAGVKMPSPVKFKHWRVPILLATVSMTISVALVAAFCWYVLDMPLGAGILLGAIVAPTDPVLATEIQIRHPGDRDDLRFNLTCEAGMNDGSTFPFVMLGLGLLGLHELGDNGVIWILQDLLWATVAGIALGVLSGVSLAHLIWRFRGQQQRRKFMDDFFGLGLIGFVYGLSLLISAWGFLAVFFAAVALHQTELKLTSRATQTAKETAINPPQAPASDLAQGEITPAPKPEEIMATGNNLHVPTVSEASLIFKEHLERLSELLLIVLVGGMLYLDSWSWQAVGFAIFLFLVARPVSIMLAMWGSETTWRMRAMASWFGVRGIGSLYYLMYAIQHGLPEPLALQFIHFTLVVVTLSILVHGTSVKPLMRIFWRRKG